MASRDMHRPLRARCQWRRGPRPHRPATIFSLPYSEQLHKSEYKYIDFSQLEYKVFCTYLDLYNVGVLYRDELVLKFDNLMKIINDSAVFDFNKFDNTEQKQESAYFNKRKMNIINQEKYFEENSIKNSLPIFDLTFSYLAYFTQNNSSMKDLSQLYLYFKQFDKDKDNFLTPEEFELAIKNIFPIELNNIILTKSLIYKVSEYIIFPNVIRKINKNRKKLL